MVGSFSGEMSMEELVAKYAGAYDSDFEAEMSEGSTEVDSDESTEDEESGSYGYIRSLFKAYNSVDGLTENSHVATYCGVFAKLDYFKFLHIPCNLYDNSSVTGSTCHHSPSVKGAHDKVL